jgi:hypothetical protein
VSLDAGLPRSDQCVDLRGAFPLVTTRNLSLVAIETGWNHPGNAVSSACVTSSRTGDAPRWMRTLLVLLLGACSVDDRLRAEGNPDPAAVLDAGPDRASAVDARTPTVPDTGCAGGDWRTGPAMGSKHHAHGLVVLADGRVLAIAGHRHEDEQPVTRCELFDPTTGAWADTGSTLYDRNGIGEDGAVLLADGRVLVADAFSGLPDIAPSEIYDPTTGAWRVVDRMGTGPVGSLTRLRDGQIFAVGGIDWVTESGLARAEIFDPVTERWRSTNAMARPRWRHVAALLPSGDVLVAGGSTGYPVDETATAEIYDVAAGTWRPSAPMLVARGGARARVLADGRVLVVGGDGANTAEIYDPVANSWTQAASMARPRSLFTLTLLGDGNVLAISGAIPETEAEEPTAELYDPGTDTWSPAGCLGQARRGHATAVLPDGRALVTGGYASTSGYLDSTEWL